MFGAKRKVRNRLLGLLQTSIVFLLLEADCKVDDMLVNPSVACGGFFFENEPLVAIVSLHAFLHLLLIGVLPAHCFGAVFIQLTFFWRGTGRSVIPTPPTLTQIQLPSFLKRSPQEPEHSNHEGDIGEETEENTARNSFGKHSEKNPQSDKGKGVGSEDAENAFNKVGHNGVDGEKQVLNDTNDDEPQRTASAPASKAVASPQDQEKTSEKASKKDESQNSASESAAKSSNTEMDRKISSGSSKKEPKLSASEPAAESKSLQLDRKSASDSSKDGPRPSVAESTPESENSRLDTKKIQKGGNDEPQLASSQPREPRKLQRNKKKFSG